MSHQHFSSNWKENSFVVRPGINSQTNQDLTRSGYLVSNIGSNCTDELGQKYCCGKDMNMELIKSMYTPKQDTIEGYEEKIRDLPVQEYNYPYKSYGKCNSELKTNIKEINISDNIYSGDVLITNGYFPETNNR